MNTTKNFHDVSAGFFFVLGFVYMISALGLRNDIMPGFMIFLMRLLDMPFALICLVYGGSGLYLQLSQDGQEEAGLWSFVIFGISLILFLIVVFVNLAFPSQL